MSGTSGGAGGVSVSGGVDSIRVDPDGLRAAAPLFAALAGQVEEVGDAVRTTGWALWAVVTDDPVTVAALSAAEQQLGGLADALTAAAAELRGLAGRLRRAAQDYEYTDRSLFDHFTGWLGSAVHAIEPAVTGVLRLPKATGAGLLRGLETRGDPSAAISAFAANDPQLADTVVDAGLLAARAWPRLGALMSAADDFLELYFADGTPRVTAAGRDDTIPATPGPRDLDDLISGLAWRDDHEDDTAGTAGGEIDVKFLHHADGSRSVIVDIPGTKDWSPAGHDPDVTGWASNLRAIRGRPSSYGKGVLTAMQRAGVRPSDHVLLVGHSLGGMVAVGVARTAVRTRRFDVTNVVTAGSPIGSTVGAVPAGVQVLALENREDTVPELDGRADPARANVITVTGDVQRGSIDGNHGLATAYEPIAGRADRSGDPSVRYFVSGAEEFLDADSVRAQRFVITRRY